MLTLPFQDQQDRFDAFNFDQTAFEQSDEATATLLASLRCPTDNQGARFFRHRASDRRFALGNYVAFVSPIHGEDEEDVPGALGGFEPGSSEGQRLAEISDGATNTLLLSEVRRRPSGKEETFDQRGAWVLPWMASTILSADLHSTTFPATTGPYVPDPNQSREDTFTPNKQVGIADTINPCSRPAEAFSVGMPCTRFTGSGFSGASPRSLHGEAVNMAFVDGRVRFVDDKVDQILYANLISSNNGNPVIRNSLGGRNRNRKKSVR